jgi:hypothetical protein
VLAINDQVADAYRALGLSRLFFGIVCCGEPWNTSALDFKQAWLD